MSDLIIFSQQIADTTPLLNELLSKTGLFSALSKISKERVNHQVNLGEKRKNNNFSTIHVQDEEISMKHFWKTETYNDKNFITCNECFVNPQLLNILINSSDEFIKSMFISPVGKDGKLVFENEIGENGEIVHSLITHQETVGSKFQHFLSSFGKLFLATEPHFVFCFDMNQDLLSQLEIYNIKERDDNRITD